MTDMKFAVVPHTTRNKDNAMMGLTQPVFPKVGDKLGQTSDKKEFEAVTHRGEENATTYEDASQLGQTQKSARFPFAQIRTMADLAHPKLAKPKKQRRLLDPIAGSQQVSSVPSGMKMRKHSLPS